jgi:putative transposase
MLLVQICDVAGVHILKGVVPKGHVHTHLEYRLSQSLSYLIKLLKGLSLRKLQLEFPALKKRYWGRHFWEIGYGYWRTGNITGEMVNEYLEHHRKPNDNTDLIVE